jgi:hypothetical protein
LKALQNRPVWGADAQLCDTLLHRKSRSEGCPHLSPRGDLPASPNTPRACQFLGAPACFYEPAEDEPGDGKLPKNEHRTIARLREMVCRTKKRPSERKRIKNAQSKRKIPLHPEVIRLNFLD